MRTFSGCIVFLVFLLTLVAIPTTLEAQQSVLVPDLTLSVFPEFPKTGENVTATIGGYSIELDSATITWSTNGKVIAKGVGVKDVSFVMPTDGSTVTLQIDVLGRNGVAQSQSQRLIPSTVDLIWESNTYAPPFYKGKALYTIGSAVSVVALAEFPSVSGFSLANPKNMIYTWKIDDAVQGSLSGTGKQRLSVTLPDIDKPTHIEVTVRSIDGSQQGYGQVVINPGIPRVVLYEENPVLGTRYNQALPDTTFLNGEEITVHAIPYFFQVPSKDSPSLQYQWGINTQRTNNQSSSPFLITLRRGANDTGMSLLSLAIQHVTKLFQSASASIQIQYGNQ